MVKEWKRQQVFDRFKQLKSSLVAEGMGEYVKGIENNNNIIDVIA
jgi:hypothetical protein